MTDLTNTLHAGLETAGAGGLLYAITVTGYYVYRGVCARTSTTRGCPRNPCHTTRPPTIAVTTVHLRRGTRTKDRSCQISLLRAGSDSTGTHLRAPQIGGSVRATPGEG